MNLDRRKFTKLAVLGGTSFVASFGILFPKPADIGNNPNVGFTNYRARQGEVTRRYDRISPELGIITFFVNSHLFNGTITTNVKFS